MTQDQTKRLRKGRLKAGFTQRTIAEKLNISVQTYRGWEKPNGTEPGSTAKLVELCQLLNISIDWLLTGASLTLTQPQSEALTHLLEAFGHKKAR